MNSVSVCALDELADPGTREFSIGTGEWPLRGFVVRYQGHVHAYVNACPHVGWPLNLKSDVFFAPFADLLQCVSHGALFEPDTGKCVAGPCFGQHLRALQIEIIDNLIHVQVSADAR